MRIISLLPSATEIVCSLGLRESLVGVTHECDYPSDVLGLPKVTRTLIPHDPTSSEIDVLVRERLGNRRALYTLDMEALERLRPEIIVTQGLCNVCAVAEEEVRQAACRLPGSPRVLNLEPASLEDVFDTIRTLGFETGLTDRANTVVAELRTRVERVVDRSRRLRRPPRVTLLEWIDPPFSCGHWSPQLVTMAGGVEGIGRAGAPSRTIRWEEVLEWRPEVFLIACCGFNVERARQDLPILAGYPGWEELPCVRSGRVHVVDGSAYFSRPGPRLVDSLEILAHTIDPERHPLPLGLPVPFTVRRSQDLYENRM